MNAESYLLTQYRATSNVEHIINELASRYQIPTSTVADFGLKILARTQSHDPSYRIQSAARTLPQFSTKERTEFIMARTKNRVELIGHVGQNPNIHYTGSGAIIASFSLATIEVYKDAKGEWAERPEWHNLVTFKRNAEIVRDYVKQGSRLRVEGRLQTRSWTDRDTNKKIYKTEIIVNEIMFLSSRDENTNPTQKTTSNSPEITSTTQIDEPPYTDIEVAQYQDTQDIEEIPF